MRGASERVRALLLAGGLGTRLRPLTDTVPKCLVDIDGRPLLEYWIDRLSQAGIREARINTHACAEQVRSYLAQPEIRDRIRLVEAHEPVLLGSAGTVAANADLADDADIILIIYADNLSDISLGNLIEYHRSHDDPFTMVLFRAANPRACGIAQVDDSGRILAFEEKPERPASDLANAGLYAVDAAAYREIAALNAFDLGFEVLPRFVGRMRGWVWGGYHRDIGTHEALQQARRDAPLLLRGPRRKETGNGVPAVFLDRDGTLIEHVHYLSSPDQVRLLPGAAEAVNRLRRAGYACIIVTNQSAIGRGIISEEQLRQIHVEMNRQLAEQGAMLDGIYFCPDVPTSDDRTIVDNPERKPGPGMLLRAAAELGLDLHASWMVGDVISDVLAGWNAGCRSILVASGQTRSPIGEAELMNRRYKVVSDLAAAANVILDPEEAHP
ncbi:MAG: HAD-IIIA family hydrolase [Isosphaeraceae bacterium]